MAYTDYHRARTGMIMIVCLIMAPRMIIDDAMMIMVWWVTVRRPGISSCRPRRR
jgi:hypothetical protein